MLSVILTCVYIDSANVESQSKHKPKYTLTVDQTIGEAMCSLIKWTETMSEQHFASVTILVLVTCHGQSKKKSSQVSFSA